MRTFKTGLEQLRVAPTPPIIVDNMSKIVRLTGKLEGARHGHLGGEVRKRIEELVLNGVMPAGARINELQLALQLKVSRGPVREALRALENSGLLVAIPNRGVFVREVRLEDALDLYEIRSGLARVAGKLLARRISTQQIATLKAIYARMEKASTARDISAYYCANLAFHSQIIEFAGNPRLTTMSEAVRNELQLYLRDAFVGRAQSRESQAEHRNILKAIIDGDAEAAGAAFEAHILSGKQRMLEYFGLRGNKKVPQYGLAP